MMTAQAAKAAYEQRRKRLIAYGQWEHPVHAAPVRAHLRHLVDAGTGPARIAELSGIPAGTVSRHLYTPTKRIAAPTARALLAISPTPVPLTAMAGGAPVEAAGTRRRLQALAAAGYTHHSLAVAAGVLPNHFAEIVHGRERVRASTARRVRELYDELWNVPPPAGTAAVRAQRRAARLGWMPAGAWEDGEIDDPAAGPHPEWVRGIGPEGPRELAPCGTPGAVKRHQRHDERCETCLAAERRRVQDATARKREGLAEALLGEDSEQEAAA
jgi:hypothetical protein